MAISWDSARLVTGYRSGTITFWDLVKRTRVKTITPPPPPGAHSSPSIVQLVFHNDGHNEVLALDDASYTHLYTLSNIMGMRWQVGTFRINETGGSSRDNTPTIATTICCIAALPPSPHFHPAESTGLVAFCTPNHVRFLVVF